MEESTMKYIRYCVVSEILFFNVIGVFGNVQLLWATFRKKSTHSKPGLAPHVFRFWSTINVIINTVVIGAYAVIIVLVRIKGESATFRESQKAIRSLKVIVIIFVFSWYMAILGVNFGYVLGLSPGLLAILSKQYGILRLAVLLTNLLRVYLAFLRIQDGLQGTAVLNDLPKTQPASCPNKQDHCVEKSSIHR
ncbi:hypothetical protein OSTOST_03365 [Ostertagia ostertagi]